MKITARIFPAAVADDGGMDYLTSLPRRVVTVYAPLTVFLVVLLFPLYWMTVTAFKPDAAHCLELEVIDGMGHDSEAAILLTSGAVPPQGELTPDRTRLRQAIAALWPGATFAAADEDATAPHIVSVMLPLVRSARPDSITVPAGARAVAM